MLFLWSGTHLISRYGSEAEWRSELHDEFWAFSRDLSPFTTKYDYEDQYFDLLLHRMDGGKLVSMTQELWQKQTPDERCRCISFFTKRPCRDIELGGPQIFHRFSLNLELFTAKSDGTVDENNYLPMTIDPDIENKGGNPGP